MNWRANLPRVNWDLHSALWLLVFSIRFALGRFRICFILRSLKCFRSFFVLDPANRITDQWLFWLWSCTLGDLRGLLRRFGRLWVYSAPVSSFTGTFICCRRVIFKKPSNPYR